MRLRSARLPGAALALALVAALGAACADPAPTEVGPGPAPVEHDADLDSVFGPAAREILRVEQAQREALARAA